MIWSDNDRPEVSFSKAISELVTCTRWCAVAVKAVVLFLQIAWAIPGTFRFDISTSWGVHSRGCLSSGGCTIRQSGHSAPLAYHVDALLLAHPTRQRQSSGELDYSICGRGSLARVRMYLIYLFLDVTNKLGNNVGSMRRPLDHTHSRWGWRNQSFVQRHFDYTPRVATCCVSADNSITGAVGIAMRPARPTPLRASAVAYTLQPKELGTYPFRMP